MHEINFQTINVVGISCMQFDNIYHNYIAKDGNKFVDLDDYKVEVYYTTPNKESFKKSCEINNNIIKIRINGNMTKNVGNTEVFLRFSNSEVDFTKKVAVINVCEFIDITKAKEE